MSLVILFCVDLTNDFGNLLWVGDSFPRSSPSFRVGWITGCFIDGCWIWHINSAKALPWNLFKVRPIFRNIFLTFSLDNSWLSCFATYSLLIDSNPSSFSFGIRLSIIASASPSRYDSLSSSCCSCNFFR